MAKFELTIHVRKKYKIYEYVRSFAVKNVSLLKITQIILSQLKLSKRITFFSRDIPS